MRLDIKIAEELSLSREKAKMLIEAGGVKVNGKAELKGSFMLEESDLLEIIAKPAPKPSSLKPENIPLDIIFEDEFLLIVNKQAGISTHPASIEGTGTLANALAGFLKEEGLRPGIVHRLDRETTGLLVIAKTEEAKTKLSEIISKRELERRYLTLVFGKPKMPTFQIKTNVGRDTRNRLKMRVIKGEGKEAITNIRLKGTFLSDEVSLLEIKLETGRTHQIRLHMEHINLPIVGEQLYGLKPPSFFNRFRQTPEVMELMKNAKRQMLHAFSLRFIHPFTLEEMYFEKHPPEDFEQLVQALELHKS